MLKNNFFTVLVSIMLIFCGVSILNSCSSGGSENETDAAKEPTAEEIAASYSGYGAVDSTLYSKGAEAFKAKCTACHQLDAKVVGPMLRDITKRRTAQWINSMMTDPAKWVQDDPIAKKVFEENNKVPMVIPGGTTEEERRALIEYLRMEGGQ